jgi:hypothetical protein
LETARIEARLDLSLSADNSCSVLWAVPEDDPGELGIVMTAIAKLSAMTTWGFVGRWERSKLLESNEADIIDLSRLAAHLSIGDTRMNADMLEVPIQESSWFWTQFGTKMRPHQICAAVVPSSTSDHAGWKYAGLQLVLGAAARQARPGSSHQYTLRALEQAFIAETLVAGGIAVTRLRAELLRPGIALTSTRDLIDRVSVELTSERAIDPLLVQRSRELSGNW